jgi:GAF domain-containing protein/ANTAR domain-containing protein
MTRPHSTVSREAFAELDRIPFAEVPLDEALARIAGVTRRAVPGTAEVSVTLLSPAGARSAAYTGRRALDLDEWQYERGHGPSLAAAAANIVVRVPDTAGDHRWHDWADCAVDAGIHSALSIGLPLRDSVSGALNLYATAPHAFDDEAAILAETLSGYAAVAMASCLQRGDAVAAGIPWASTSGHLVLEQARGIIIAERRCGPVEALAVLRQMAEESRRPVHDVAAILVNRAGWRASA